MGVNLLTVQQAYASLLDATGGLKLTKLSGGTMSSAIETSGGAAVDGGNNFAKLTASGSHTIGYLQFNERVDVTAGTEYTLSFYVSTDQPNTTYIAFTTYIKYYDSGGSLLSTKNTSCKHYAESGTDWVRYELTFTPPTNTAKIDMELYGGVDPGKYWGYDAIQLEIGSPASNWDSGGSEVVGASMVPDFRLENACAPLAIPLPRGDMNYPGRVLHIGMQELDPVANKNLLYNGFSNITVAASGNGLWKGSTATLSIDASAPAGFSGSLKMVGTAPDGGSSIIAHNPRIPVIAGQSYSIQFWAKAGTYKGFRLLYWEYDALSGGTQLSSARTDFTITGDWVKYTVENFIPGAGTTHIYLAVLTQAAATYEFYVQGFQMEKSATATSWVLGNGNLQVWGKPKLIDLSNDPSNGTITGAVTEYAPIGYCRKFDGVDDYVDCGNPPRLRGWTAFSVEAWAYVSADKSVVRSIVGKHSTSGATGTGWMLFKLDTSGVVQFKMYDGAGNQAFRNWAPAVGWHHIIATFDGSFLRLYGDTVLAQEALAVTGHLPADSNNFIIGRYVPSGTWYWDEKIGLVVAYNRALSAIEAKQRYNMNAWRYGLPQK